MENLNSESNIFNKIAVRPSMENWDELMEFVTSEAKKYVTDKKKSYGLILASEEIISNIVRASGDKEKVLIEISSQKYVSKDKKKLFSLTISDNGIKFDPKFKTLTNPCPDIPASDRKIGGLGLFLVKNSCDHVNYIYQNPLNIYTLSTYIDSLEEN